MSKQPPETVPDPLSTWSELVEAKANAWDESARTISPNPR